MPGGFGALLLRPDALPDANPPLSRAWDRLSGVLDWKTKKNCSEHAYIVQIHRIGIFRQLTVGFSTSLLIDYDEPSQGIHRQVAQVQRAFSFQWTWFRSRRPRERLSPYFVGIFKTDFEVVTCQLKVKKRFSDSHYYFG